MAIKRKYLVTELALIISNSSVDAVVIKEISGVVLSESDAEVSHVVWN